MINILSLSLQGSWDTIVVGKNIIRILDNPKFISLRISNDYRSIAVVPCESKDVMSFRVPEKLFESKNCSCKIHSKGFIFDVLTKNNLDPLSTYAIHGTYVESQKAVVFNLNDAKIANAK